MNLKQKLWVFKYLSEESHGISKTVSDVFFPGIFPVTKWHFFLLLYSFQPVILFSFYGLSNVKFKLEPCISGNGKTDIDFFMVEFSNITNSQLLVLLIL